MAYNDEVDSFVFGCLLFTTIFDVNKVLDFWVDLIQDFVADFNFLVQAFLLPQHYLVDPLQFLLLLLLMLLLFLLLQNLVLNYRFDVVFVLQLQLVCRVNSN